MEKDFNNILLQVNQKASVHEIGSLPKFRMKLKDKKRLPKDIFPASTTFDHYAFHFGGRKELQFNIGYDKGQLRYGVAFSLETNQTLPDIAVLIPKIKLFNDYINLYSEDLSDLRMWHYESEQEKPSPDYFPTPIPPDLVKDGTFIFLGKRQKLDRLNVESILDCLDRLLPLYLYVESNGQIGPVLALPKGSFEFHSGFTSHTAVSQRKRTDSTSDLDIDLLHNRLQENLCKHLAKKYGLTNVGENLPTGIGTYIDVVLKQGKHYWFYEIKTDHSSRACIRMAIGQLLEYSFWPGTQVAEKLIVCGENPLDSEGKRYLKLLRNRFKLPLFYEQINE